MEQTKQTKLSAVSFFHSWSHRPFSLSIVFKLVWATSSQSQFGWCSQSCFDHMDRQMGDEKLSVVFIYHLHPLWSWSCSQDVSLCLRRWNRLNVQTMRANRVNPVEMLSRLFAPFTSTWKGSGMRPSEMVWRQQRWGLSINIGDHDWRIQRTLCFHWVSRCESWAESSSCLVHTLLDWFPFHLILCLKGFLFVWCPFAFSQHVCEHVWPCWIKAMIHQPSSSHGRFWTRELSTRPWPQGSMEFLNVRSMTCSGSASMLWKLISHRASLNSQQCSQGFSVFEPSNKVKWPPISEINKCCYLLPWKNHVFARFGRA